MKSFAFSLLIVSAIICSASPLSAAPVHLRTNYRETPLGIDSEKPRFLWQSDSTERGWKQSAYRILVASDPGLLTSRHPDIWDSGKRMSDDSVDVPFEGKPLLSGHRYFWTVEVWGPRGSSTTATPTWFEMGLLSPADWKAKWISGNETEEEADRAAAKWIAVTEPALTGQSVAVFQKTITLARPAFQASISVIANGAFESTVNGHPISHKSGWQSFDFHEIHADLHTGENIIEIRAKQPQLDNRTQMRSAWAVAALVKIVDEDGTVHRYGTGTDWTVANAGVTLAAPGTYLKDSGPTAHMATNLRKPFSVSNKITSARLYITAMGSYSASLNGLQIGNDVLTPDFTDYRKRVNYQTYDVTSMVKSGANTLNVLLGSGWYGSGLTWAGAYSFGTAQPSVLARLVVETADGKTTDIVTDSTWQSSKSPILNSEIYAGETFDARVEKESRWDSAVEVPTPQATLTAQDDLPVHKKISITPIQVSTLANGDAVFDMGQNMVGWTRLTVHGESGKTIHLQYAERLNPDGSVYTENLRSAEANDTYILNGHATEVFEPSFTFHGFRYVQVSGYPGTPDRSALEGEVINSLPSEPAAKLNTSSELVNKMWTAGLWGQRGNFVSIPTDCPQRDERLGWMGDAGVFWRTGAYNFDIDSFSHKFLRDVDDAQTPAGAFTNISPDLLHGNDSIGAPGWGDAGVIVPYTTWLQYGDRSAIDQNWPQMERWMAFLDQANSDHIRRNEVGPNYGDWLAPDDKTPKDLVGTAYWALIAKMMHAMAVATGRTDQAQHYADLESSIRTAFQKAYVHNDGDVAGSSQTSYLLTLYLHLAPANTEKGIAYKLVADIDAHGTHLTTGFLGTPFLLSVLDEQGRLETAYKLLLNDTYPSWGYMIAKGSTTWWERWNGDTGDPSMNSYNHYAFGSVMAWVYRRVAGIDTAESGPGFHHIVIAPQLSPLMTSTSAEYESVYGTIKTSWKNAGGNFSLDVTIPANASATVIIPSSAGRELYEGGKHVTSSTAALENSIQVGAGSYHFEARDR
jgi:alpha-L-rhamnosidase